MLSYGQLRGLVTGLSKQNIAEELFSQPANDTQELELTEHTFFGSCDKLVIGLLHSASLCYLSNGHYKEYLVGYYPVIELTMELQSKRRGKTPMKNISAVIKQPLKPKYETLATRILSCETNNFKTLGRYKILFG